MRSPHPCLGMAKENLRIRKHRLGKSAMDPSLPHPMVREQTSILKLSIGKGNKSGENCLTRGFRLTETGSRMASFPKPHLILPSNSKQVRESVPKVPDAFAQGKSHSRKSQAMGISSLKRIISRGAHTLKRSPFYGIVPKDHQISWNSPPLQRRSQSMGSYHKGNTSRGAQTPRRSRSTRLQYRSIAS